MPSQVATFKNREEAGKILAENLKKYADKNPVILGIPRGGVVVAYEIARILGAPLDTVVARKLGAPFNPEFGFGAIAPANTLIIEDGATASLGLNQTQIDEVIKNEREELERRIKRYKMGDYSKDNSYDTVIIVDDGLATGVTATAAIQSIKKMRHPQTVVFASPVCAAESSVNLSHIASDVVCRSVPHDLVAIACWYENFEQVSDERVIGYLNDVYNERARAIIVDKK